MSEFDTQFAFSAPLAFATLGQPIAYRAMTNGRVTESQAISLAIVSDRGGEGYQDEHGRFWSRAIDVRIKISDRASIAEHDVIVWNSEEWSIIKPRKVGGTHHFIAVRHERMTTTTEATRQSRRTVDNRSMG